MKVLLISHACKSRTSGQEKARWLAAKFGVELQVVVPTAWRDYGKWAKPEFPVDSVFGFNAMKIRWPWMGPAQSYLHWYPGLRELLEGFRPDLIDLWEEPWGLVSAHTVWLRDRILPQTKVICETEQNIFKRLPPPFESIRKYVLKRADLMVGRSTESIDVLRRKGYTGPAELVPNAVDTAVFRPMDRQSCRKAIEVGGFVIGYVGRLVEQKGLSDLVQAVAECPASANLLIVGRGPFEGEIRRLVDVLGLGGRVRLIPEVPMNDLPPIFNAMDVLAVPSRTTARWKEQFGRVIIEAHACGVPVIGSDSGAIPEVIGNGGLVVPEQNVTRLAEGLKLMMTDEPRRVAMGQAGLEAATEQFTWLAVARRMREVYDRTLALPKRGGSGRLHEQSGVFAPDKQLAEHS